MENLSFSQWKKTERKRNILIFIKRVDRDREMFAHVGGTGFYSLVQKSVN